MPRKRPLHGRHVSFNHATANNILELRDELRRLDGKEAALKKLVALTKFEIEIVRADRVRWKKMYDEAIAFAKKHGMAVDDREPDTPPPDAENIFRRI